jgi:hypothetical protein
MGSDCPFGHLKHKLWSKERPGVKLPIWLLTTKSRESTKFPCVQATCRWHATWKALDESYNFASNHITIAGLHRKLCASKVARILVMGILDLPLESPETKNHLDVAPVERCRIYYKGECGGFPQVRAVVNLVCPSCSWFVLAPKVHQLCTNHFVLVLCRSVWVIKACHFFLVPSRNSNTPLYLSIVLRGREHVPIPCLPLFSIWDSHLSPLRS